MEIEGWVNRVMNFLSHNSWVSLEPFSVILSGGQPKMY